MSSAETNHDTGSGNDTNNSTPNFPNFPLSLVARMSRRKKRCKSERGHCTLVRNTFKIMLLDPPIFTPKIQSESLPLRKRGSSCSAASKADPVPDGSDLSNDSGYVKI